jgi:hypothetical protein
MQNTIEINGKQLQLPTSWNDLSKSDFLWIAKKFQNLIGLQNSNDETYAETYYATKILLVNRLCKKILSRRQSLSITAYQYADLLPITDFLENEIDLDQQHIPFIRIRGRKYYGPQTGLHYSTFNEFISADSYFINIHKKQDPLLLFKLIACLYRPKQKGIKAKKRNQSWNGDIRSDFNENMIEARAKLFQKHLSPKTAHAILYFYWGFRNVHVMKFKNVFEEPAETTSEDVVRVGNNYGWAGTLLELSGDKFGNIEETKGANWFSVFVEMSRQIDIAARNAE